MTKACKDRQGTQPRYLSQNPDYWHPVKVDVVTFLGGMKLASQILKTLTCLPPHLCGINNPNKHPEWEVIHDILTLLSE